jgi:hypothetical protein
MMPPFLTVASTLMCPHGGTVTATAGSTRGQTASPVLRVSDTFIVVGCPFVIAGVPNPCVRVRWVQGATRVKHSGDFALHQESVGLCVSGAQAPQGPVVIVATQAKAGGL